MAHEYAAGNVYHYPNGDRTDRWKSVRIIRVATEQSTQQASSRCTTKFSGDQTYLHFTCILHKYDNRRAVPDSTVSSQLNKHQACDGTSSVNGRPVVADRCTNGAVVVDK